MNWIALEVTQRSNYFSYKNLVHPIDLRTGFLKLSSRLSTGCNPSIISMALLCARSLSIRASRLPARKSVAVILRVTKGVGMKRLNEN